MVRFDNRPIIKSTFPNNEKQYDDFFDICKNNGLDEKTHFTRHKVCI